MQCFEHTSIAYYGKVHPDLYCSADVVEEWLEDQRVLTNFQCSISFQTKKE